MGCRVSTEGPSPPATPTLSPELSPPLVLWPVPPQVWQKPSLCRGRDGYPREPSSLGVLRDPGITPEANKRGPGLGGWNREVTQGQERLPKGTCCVPRAEGSPRAVARSRCQRPAGTRPRSPASAAVSSADRAVAVTVD